MLVLLLAASIWAGIADAAPLPPIMDVATLGQPTFEETWAIFDASEMPRRPPKPTRWRTVTGQGDATKAEYRSGSEMSLYVDRTFRGVKDGRLGDAPLGIDPFIVEPDASLRIRAIETPARFKSVVFDRAYLSGFLTTKFSFSQLFGYFEIRAKLPVGKGLWPAWWLMPIVGKWPVNGELDIVEGLGVANEIWCSVHSGEKGKERSQKISLPFDVAKDWHSYGVAWSAEEIVWYVDRKEVYRTSTPADMKTVPMYLILNLAVGGSWGGKPDGTTPMPADFRVGHVTVWRLSA
ncbi:glycoside hydrolase family 16 protein [Methylobacterium sp. BTF04]|uniref:glycoside hydrolase family 16 protein n=1 Tax=Methylobacterium sp. BTF04 TaxID=2708300 RepID=UPI0013D2FE1F|nr:glycoside hydrolase family 16 protein [Methylobacterium sp. BTF04]NEU14466.1 glycoside hydrolase family 16 protein [Methylobacterium sp. BTF04]